MSPMCDSKEELVNSLTSAIGVVLCFIGGFFLVEVLTHKPLEHTLALSVYFLCMVFTYLASTLYHGFSGTRFGKTLRVLDHCSIYLAIAGSYTPYLILYFSENYGWLYLTIIWSIAILGVLYKIKYTGVHEDFSLASYLLFGWIGFLILYEMLEFMTYMAFVYFVIAATCYTVGTYFYKNDNRKNYHAIWHILCTLGSAAHFMSLLECFSSDIL